MFMVVLKFLVASTFALFFLGFLAYLADHYTQD